MQEIMIDMINSFGYVGIALLILIENIFPPVPSEVVLLFGGFATTKTDMNIFGVIIAATCGSVLGATILYYSGYGFGKERLKRLFSGKLGRILHFEPSDIDKAERQFVRFGGKAVIICRCIPIVRSIISIPAGIAKMRFVPFVVLTMLGSTVWNTVLVLMGALAGNAWENGLQYVDVYTKIAAAVFVVIAAAVFFIYRRRKKKSQAE